MAKYVNDLVLDAALDFVSSNASSLVLCDAEPADFTAATTDSPTGVALGEIAVDGADFTKADGDVSGRKITVAAQTGINVDVTGTVNHIAIVDATNSRLLLVTTTTAQAVSQGGTADTTAFDQEVADPS